LTELLKFERIIQFIKHLLLIKNLNTWANLEPIGLNPKPKHHIDCFSNKLHLIILITLKIFSVDIVMDTRGILEENLLAAEKYLRMLNLHEV
jgi:hypothetical protein